MFVNALQYPHTLKSNIYHSNKRGLPLLFHWDTNHVLGQALVHSVDETHVLDGTAESIWFLLLNMRSSTLF